MKEYFSKAVAQVVLFCTQLTDQQKTYIVVALLGVLFYFLFYAGDTSRGGFSGRFGGRNRYSSRPYDMNRPDTRTYTDTRGSKQYNDEYPRYDETDSSRYNDCGSDRVHRSGSRYNGNQDHRGQNYGFDTSYGLSWPVWGAIIACAYKLPPYFEAQLGPEYGRPFFGMTLMSFTMLLNMLSNSMRGRREGSGLFRGVFNRRRRY
jgi:hypothetical protein